MKIEVTSSYNHVNIDLEGLVAFSLNEVEATELRDQLIAKLAKPLNPGPEPV